MKMDKDKVENFVNSENWKEKRVEEVLFLDNETCIMRYNQAFGRFQLLVSKSKKGDKFEKLFDRELDEKPLFKPSFVSNNVLDILGLAILHGSCQERWSFGEERMNETVGLILKLKREAELDDESINVQLHSLRKQLNAMPEMNRAESNLAYAKLLIQESGRLDEGDDFETLLRVMNRVCQGILLPQQANV